jgi:hypothetical protein
MNIGEANDLNILLTHMAGRHPGFGDWPLPSVEEYQAAAERLAGRAHRVLFAGWTPDRLRAAWMEQNQSAEADHEAQP